MVLTCGFSAAGFAAAAPVDAREQERFRSCLSAGYHADMRWLADSADKRFDPSRVVPGARTVIVLATNYYTGAEPYLISKYAALNDYHLVLHTRLKKLMGRIRESFPDFTGKHWTDTGPIMEKYWAEKAGVGWRGKNTLIHHDRYGSWIFLSEIITPVEIEPDKSLTSRCGKCRKCIEACPTGALTEEGALDARLCISYLTVENRKPLTDGEKNLLRGPLFGCDICQLVCPYNKMETGTRDEDLVRPGFPSGRKIAFFAALTKEQFEAYFAGTPVSRISYEKFMEHVKAMRVRHSRG